MDPSQRSSTFTSTVTLSLDLSAIISFPPSKNPSHCRVDHLGDLAVFSPRLFPVAGAYVKVTLCVSSGDYLDDRINHDLFIMWKGKGSSRETRARREIHLNVMVDIRNAKCSGLVQAWYDSDAYESDVIELEKFKTDVDMREATAQDKIRQANEVMASEWYSTLSKLNKFWTNDPVAEELQAIVRR